VKKITLLVLLAAISIVVIYQFQKPILTENNAILKAKEYVQLVNERLGSTFDTEKPANYCVLDEDTIWNKFIGNRRWSAMIDGVAVDIRVDSGQFIQMVFPLDGVITELPE